MYGFLCGLVTLYCSLGLLAIWGPPNIAHLGMVGIEGYVSKWGWLVCYSCYHYGLHPQISPNNPFNLYIELLTIISIVLILLIEGTISSRLGFFGSPFCTWRPPQQPLPFTDLHDPLLRDPQRGKIWLISWWHWSRSRLVLWAMVHHFHELLSMLFQVDPLSFLHVNILFCPDKQVVIITWGLLRQRTKEVPLTEPLSEIPNQDL